MINVLDFLFPKRCVQCKKLGDYLCSNCFAFLSFDVKSLCLVCRRGSVDGFTHPVCKGMYTIDGCFSAVPYNKTAKKLIYNLKYKPYLSSLNKFLGDLLYESLIQNENFMRIFQSAENWVFVPIPLYSSKFRMRGYNQSEILAKELGKRFGIDVQNLLKRIKNTKTQFKLDRKERAENMKNAFAVQMGEIGQMRGKSVFLVDDVVTTGSTLLEAANVLKRNGAGKVYGITLARD